MHADLSGLADFHVNDLITDATGRAYVGNFGYDRHRGEAERSATLMRVDPDGRVSAAATDLISEGALAMEMDAFVEDIGLTIHPHPTLGESVGMAAEVYEGVCTDRKRHV